MKKIVTFGEIMLRLAPFGYSRLLQEPKLEATFGGAEANVAVSLANFGMDSTYVTKLPQNPIGQAALSELRKFGVDVSSVAFGGERLGVYYLEKGASQRPSLCVYDRKGSSISEASAKDFDWPKIFKGAAAFHFTGVTPALSKSTAAICLEAAKAAKKMGLTVFCDLNYRKKLWSKAQAKKTMTELCKYVDVCLLNEEDACNVFGIKAASSNVNQGKLNSQGYQEVAKELCKRFNFKAVAISQRESYSASQNGWSGIFYDKKNFYSSKKYDLLLVERVGGGDAFAAGIIYSMLNKYSPQKTIDFAAAASALKQTIEGDFNRVTVEEVERLSNGDTSGRVLR
ncbi:MAG: sugar kinase [Treponema sp.]|nr:sugar kinase [Treponema sp.]